MLEEQVARAFAADPRVVLAVSGGCDSMVLLHAAARAARGRIAAVATFDHRSGAAARRAAALVVREAARLGFPVRHGKALARLHGEAAWRAARWAFLRGVARELDAVVATAHTRDDQVETVIMRVLRGSGARGLAGLYAESDVRRPLLDVPRAGVLAYARAHGVRWVEDPSNRSRAHLRNRIRMDLAPALERAHPGFALEMLALAHRAAALRHDVERAAHALGARREGSALAVARDALLRYDANGLAMLWPVLAAQLGLALDRRGVARLAAFTRDGRAGARIPLAGGFEAVAHRGNILLRPAVHPVSAGRAVRVGRGAVTVGAWRFRPSSAAGDALWCAALPADAELTARAWRPGDRMTPLGADAPRRVKGLLRDAGLDAARRAGWPVVLAGEEIVWIPGVRRSLAATERSGRPVVTLCCEPRDDG